MKVQNESISRGIIRSSNEIFMNTEQYIGQRLVVTIDRPLGSLHPKWNFEYLVNYGYISGIISGDGEELDAYVLGVSEPVESFEGVCIAVIRRAEEDDDKLIVVPEGIEFSDEQIRQQTAFQEKDFTIAILK